MTPKGDRGRRSWADLGPRFASAMILLPLVVITLFFGGVLFALVVGAVFALTYQEWELISGAKMVSRFGPVRIGLVALIGVAYGAGGDKGHAIATAVMIAAVLFALVSGGNARWWRAAGVLFVGVVIIAVLAIRGDTGSGLVAGFFLGTAVWATDTGAFFSGRLIGGVKLSPDISPSKTWSGALGGLATGTLAALLVWVVAMWFVETPSPWWIGALLGALLSLAGQVGDLLESAVKRYFMIKDSGDIIPGHGGLMDRLDSLTVAALVLFAVGAVHGGFDRVAEGFLYW